MPHTLLFTAPPFKAARCPAQAVSGFACKMRTKTPLGPYQRKVTDNSFFFLFHTRNLVDAL